MTYLSDAELLALVLANPDLPDWLKKSDGRVVRCGAASPGVAQTESVDQDAALLSELERMLEIKLAPSSPDDSADVEFLEQTALGTRATVVQIRDGKVKRIIGQV